MTPRWCDNRLDLGLLGEVVVREVCGQHGVWIWRWKHDGGDVKYLDAELAQRAAEVWVRRALKQAQRMCP